MQGIHIKNASGKTGSLVNGDLNLEVTVVDISKIVTTDVSEAALGKMGKTFVADATFTGIDNKIVMPGIVTALQLEVGDVIQFSNAVAQNNKPRTVESITDNNEIIVNYEHCGSRGNGSLKLTNETVMGATVKLLAKWFVAADGLGQGWVVLTSSRVQSTSYTNTTGRAISVILSCKPAANASLTVYINGAIILDFTVGSGGGTGANPTASGDTFLVPKGAAYYANYSLGFAFWSELR